MTKQILAFLFCFIRELNIYPLHPTRLSLHSYVILWVRVVHCRHSNGSCLALSKRVVHCRHSDGLSCAPVARLRRRSRKPRRLARTTSVTSRSSSRRRRPRTGRSRRPGPARKRLPRKRRRRRRWPGKASDGSSQEERLIREINSCESESLRDGEREVQTDQEEMRAETPALEQTQSSQQCEPDAGGGEGKEGGGLILNVIPFS